MDRSSPLKPDLSSSRWVLGAIYSVIAALVIAHLFNRFALGGDNNFLRINAEGNPVTWFSSMLFFSAAVTSFAHARLYPATRVAWYALAFLMLGLSIDEISTIHERIEGATDSTWSFLVIQPIIALGAVALLVTIARGLDAADRPLIGAAIASLILAQVGSILYSRLELDGVVGAAQALAEEIFELSVPTFVLACAFPHVWRRIGPVFRD